MTKWWKRLRATVAMGAIWGVIWGLVGGFVMEAIVDPNGRIGDMWPPFFAMLGFAGGVLFSILLWATQGRRRFDELSLPGFTSVGALGGLVLGAWASASLNAAAPAWASGVVLLAPVVLCAASASCTLLLARRAEGRLAAGPDTDELEAPAADSRTLPSR